MGYTGPTVGEQMWDRASKHGQWSGMVGENLSYGSKNGKDAMIQLLIDDGVASRGHRKNIFSSDYKLVGVGIQTHKKYKWMTCTNFARRSRPKRKRNYQSSVLAVRCLRLKLLLFRFPVLAMMKIPMTGQMTPIKGSRVGTAEMMTAGPPLKVAVQALGIGTRLGTKIGGNFFVCFPVFGFMSYWAI
jgi:hypothetical protein